MSIENLLKQARLKKGYTQEEMAEKSWAALRSYQYYEAGVRVPDAYTAIRIARILESTVEQLFPITE